MDSPPLSTAAGGLHRSVSGSKADSLLPLTMDARNSEKNRRRSRSRAPLRQAAPTVYLPSLRSSRNNSNGDRFIPNRSATDFDFAHYMLTEPRNEMDNTSAAPASLPSNEVYTKLLSEVLFNKRTRILAFQNMPPAPTDRFSSSSNAVYSLLPKLKKRRYISQSPDWAILVSGMADDYNQNLLDWGSSDVLLFTLGNVVCLCNSDGSDIVVTEVNEDIGPVTSVSWAPDGQHLAVGLNNSDIQLWDSSNFRLVRTLRGVHQSRVGSLAWNNNILTTGGMDGKIANNDVRIRSSAVQTFRGHTLEVCRLKWSGSGQQLASGGNDSLLHIWDLSMVSSTPPLNQHQWVHRIEDHMGAVKALAWYPFQSNMLASGGGKCIKFWNTQTGACLNSVNTGSQVCSLLWNKNERELLSSHGSSRNHLTLWKYPSMVKMVELDGHASSVVYMAQSPNGCTVVSAAAGGDKMMFWNIFGNPDVAKPTAKASAGPFCSYYHLR